MRILSALLLITGFGFADTITFRDGHTVTGSFVGGDTRSIRVAVGDRVETYSVADVSGISFAGAAQAVAPPVLRYPPEERRAASPPQPPARREEFAERATVPSGTVLTIRMVDSVDSERDRVGQTCRASLDEPVVDSGGNTLIPRGSDVVVKLVDDQQSGKLAGRTVLTLDLVSVRVNGRD